MAKVEGALAWKTLAKWEDAAILNYFVETRKYDQRHAENCVRKLREQFPKVESAPPATEPTPPVEPSTEMAKIDAEAPKMNGHAPAPIAPASIPLAVKDFGPETEAGKELAKLVAPTIMVALCNEIARQTGELRPTLIHIEGREPVKLTKRTHPAFHKVLRLVNSRQPGGARTSVMLVGPAGCGKTTLAHDIATALGLKFTAFSCSAGASESQLLGRLLPTGEGGRFEYVESPFVQTYREGGVILIDEMDAADPNLLLVLNTALSNGGMYVEARAASGLDVYVPRHPDTVIIAAANTFGHGADVQYVGRAPLDAATLDRYYRLPMDYDRDLEESLGDAEIVAWVRDIREKATKAQLRRVVSTRAILRVQAAVNAGLSLAEAKADELASWKADERAKVGM